MFNRLRILSIRHHLLWEFFVYWTSSWGIIIGLFTILVVLGYFMDNMDIGFEVVLMLCFIFPTFYWMCRCKIKAYNALSKWVDKLVIPKKVS